jgi:hypothetical protein
MTENPQRVDPVDRDYNAVHACESVSNVLFWIAAVLSIAVLLIEKATYPVLFQIVQIAFALVVIALFALGLALRLYWSPMAEDARRGTFISDAYNVAITPEQTTGFYNNAETEPLQRLGLSLMENCYFTRAVTLEMLKKDRLIIPAYAALFLVIVFVRSTDLAVIPIAAQALFSEQLLSRWCRLEWLSHRAGATYKRLYELFQAPPAARTRNARILDAFAVYETSKANAGIALSSPIFFKLNPRLSEDWKKILAALKRAQPSG